MALALNQLHYSIVHSVHMMAAMGVLVDQLSAQTDQQTSELLTSLTENMSGQYS